jgi:hypothetical protein
MPSIQPTQSASSTAAGQVTRGTPVLFHEIDRDDRFAKAANPSGCPPNGNAGYSCCNRRLSFCQVVASG